jgi:hypothetical protein
MKAIMYRLPALGLVVEEHQIELLTGHQSALNQVAQLRLKQAHEYLFGG